MKLQINDSGAWRNICPVTDQTRDEVMRAAADLLRSMQQPKTTMRLADGDRAVYYCKAPLFLWSFA